MYYRNTRNIQILYYLEVLYNLVKPYLDLKGTDNFLRSLHYSLLFFLSTSHVEI